MQHNPEFEALLQSLVNTEVTNVDFGGEEDTSIVIDLGDNNSIFIHSAWRLAQNGKVVASWNDEVDEEDLNPPINKLMSQKLESITVGDLFDLKLTFDKGHRLDVFCDLYTPDEITEFEENWSVADIKQNLCFVVTENFTLLKTKYNTQG